MALIITIALIAAAFAVNPILGILSIFLLIRF